MTGDTSYESMNKHNFKRLLLAGWTNFTRNTYLSVAVTGVMSLTLLLILGLMSFQFLTSSLVTSLEDKLDISVYFKTEAPDDQALSVKSDLEKLPEVSSVVYISREQVLVDFRSDHADEPTTLQALDELDDNPFGATLNIRAKDAQQYSAITTFVEHSRYREQMRDIQNNQEVIKRINSLTTGLRTWGFVVTLIIALIAILITFNTIRLTIYNQKQEIEIMRLVGASNWQIRGPYLTEGGMYGLFSTVISLLIFYPVLYHISGKMSSFIPDVNLFHYFARNSWQFILITLVIGLALGILSSIIAIRKHLKI